MKKSSWLISVMIFLFSCFSFAANASNCSEPTAVKNGVMEVTKLRVKGEERTEIPGVPIVPPGAKNTENCLVTLGQSFLSGTEITAPTRTTITLKSINGSEIDLDPGCRLVIDTVNTKGESYILREGLVWFDVVKNLSFFHVDYQGRFVALVKGTRFSTSVQPSKLIQFEVEVGRVEIVRTGKIRIDEGNKDIANIQEVETIDSETNRSVSYPLDTIEYLKEFKTYKDAENYYREQLEQALKTGEYDNIQRGRGNLGVILITLGRPGEALPYLEQGIKDSDAKAKELEPRITSVEAAKITSGTQKPVEGAQWHPLLLTMLGITHVSLGHYQEGIDYASHAYEVYTGAHPHQEDQNTPLIASIYSTFGMGYGGLGEFRKTIDYTKRAIAIDSRSDVNNTDSLTVEYTLVALAYNELGYHQRSIDTIEKGSAFNQSPLMVMTNNYYLSRAYIGLGDYQGAIAIADKAQALSKEIGLDQNDGLNAVYYLNLSQAQLGLGDYKLALQYAKKTL